MKDNLFWTVVLINLLSVASLLGWITYDPRPMKALMSGGMTEFLEQTLQNIDSGVQERGGGPIASTNSSPGGPRNAAEVVRNMPPGAAPYAGGASAGIGTPTARATYLGPSVDTISTSAPRQELYPWNIDSRSLPDEQGEIEVVFHVKNMSGKHWKPAQIIMESEPYPRPYVWEVLEWRDREVAELSYKFPLDELRQRLSRLRVRQVQGVTREGALSDIVAEQRERAALEAGSEEGVFDRTLSEAERRRLLAESVEVARPAGTDIPAELNLDAVDESLESDRKAVELATAAHQAAQRADATLDGFLTQIQENGLLDVLESGTGRVEAKRLKGDLDVFSEAAMGLTLHATRAGTPGALSLQEQVQDMSVRLTTACNSVDDSIRGVDPTFSIRD